MSIPCLNSEHHECFEYKCECPCHRQSHGQINGRTLNGQKTLERSQK